MRAARRAATVQRGAPRAPARGAAQARLFQTGDEVHVKAVNAKGVIAEPLKVGGQNAGLYKIRYPDGSTYHVHPDGLLPASPWAAFDKVDAATLNTLPVRRVRCGWVVVPAGERWVISDVASGEVRQLRGPARQWAWCVDARPQARVIADQTEAIEVRLADGRKEQHSGPAALWFDPQIHQSAKVVRPTSLAHGECLVVYAQCEDGSPQVRRRVIHGPALYLPRATEWLHDFVWMNPGTNRAEFRFKKLRTVPDKLYFTVDNVRTRDDALLQHRLMVFYEIRDVDAMLDSGRDPIRDIVNAATADIIDHATALKFDEFKTKTDVLNALATYPQLVSRAAACGFTITKVVFVGYIAPPNIQKMQDQAIAQRVKLQLQQEEEEMGQRLQDYRQTCEGSRREAEEAQQWRTAQHAARVADHDLDAELARGRKTAAFDSERARDSDDRRLRARSAEDALRAAHLRAVADAGADLTAVMCAELQPRPDRHSVVSLLRGRGDDAPLHAHVHMPQAPADGAGGA